MIETEDIIEKNKILQDFYLFKATLEQIQMIKNIVKSCDRFCLREKQIEYVVLEAVKPYLKGIDK